MNRQELLAWHSDLCGEGRKLMEEKNRDYSGASGDPFANFRGSDFLGIPPELGILLRCQDKFQRIRAFTEKGELTVKEESVYDSIVDVINYMVLLSGMIKEKCDDES